MSDASPFGCKVISGHKIVTSFDYPPIPDRNYDWSATLADYDGAPDATGPTSLIGHGKTEAAAVADLLEQLDMLHELKALTMSDNRRTDYTVPAEPTMGMWDDFCAVYEVPFDTFIVAYKAMLAGLPTSLPEKP
jgi:hypothetical protein